MSGRKDHPEWTDGDNSEGEAENKKKKKKKKAKKGVDENDNWKGDDTDKDDNQDPRGPGGQGGSSSSKDVPRGGGSSGSGGNSGGSAGSGGGAGGSTWMGDTDDSWGDWREDQSRGGYWWDNRTLNGGNEEIEMVRLNKFVDMRKHIEEGHMVYDPNCQACVKGHMRMRQHRRIKDEKKDINVLSADLTGPHTLSVEGHKYILVSVFVTEGKEEEELTEVEELKPICTCDPRRSTYVALSNRRSKH